MKTKITIEQLAERLDKTVWQKDDLKRIYLNDAGFNTNKMSTKTWIFKNPNGVFEVACRIDCPSQHSSWISSQEEKVKEDVYQSIEKLLADVVYLVINERCEYIDDCNNVTPLNEIYSDYMYFKTQAEDIVEEYGEYKDGICNLKIVTMSVDDFKKEVSRLDEIEINLPLKIKFERGDTISFGSFNIDCLKQRIDEEAIWDIITIDRIYHDGSGAFRLRKDGDKSAMEILNEFESKKSAPKLTHATSVLTSTTHNFGVGTKVNHSKFGDGYVINEDNDKVWVRFEEGEKMLLKKFSNLTINE